MTQYVPYYSINETTRWAHVPPADTVVSSSPARLSSAAAERAPPRAVPELASALAQSEDFIQFGEDLVGGFGPGEGLGIPAVYS